MIKSQWAVRDARRITAQIYLRSQRQEDILLARMLKDVFATSALHYHKEFWRDWKMERVHPLCSAIIQSGSELGVSTLGELITLDYEKLCAAPGMTERAMAFLLDYSVAFGLTIPGAPPAPVLLDAKVEPPT